MKIGYSLPSQDIRKLISEGRLITRLEKQELSIESLLKQESVEKRIQPSSFEPIIQDELFVIDTEIEGLFRPSENDTVYRSLLSQLSMRQRRNININNGYQLNVGHSYLFPLKEKIILKEDERIKSSPKSTSGRDFLNCRMLVDYHTQYDEARYRGEKCLDLWLLVQPLAFNVIVKPGLIFNQLRFFKGNDSLLSESETIQENKKNSLLLYYHENCLIPKKIEFGELTLKLNLEGKNSSGIIALQTRHNPEPIDLSKIKTLQSEDYFEPVTKKNGNFTPIPGKYYLLSSQEVINIPPHLNAELRATHHTGLQGLLHFAGFIDNGFYGDLVLELRSDERTPVELKNGTPISVIDVYRCREKADKIYGKTIGSNYQEQKGPQVSKHLKDFDYKKAGKEYEKLDKLVLVEQKEKLLELRRGYDGFEPLDDVDCEKIIEKCEKGFFSYRYNCEDDERILQIIPYILIFGSDNTIFTYTRAKDIKDYGDERLFDKHSIGFGGHVQIIDKPHYINNGIKRELEEEVKCKNTLLEPKLVGTLYKPELPVDKVHFGLIYAVKTNLKIFSNTKAITIIEMKKIRELNDNPRLTLNSETWTKALIPHLYNIKKLIDY